MARSRSRPRPAYRLTLRRSAESPISPWTQDLSSGEAIRSGYDQNVTLSPCHLQYLYQGKDPSANQDYNHLPWRIGLTTQTNSTC